MADGPTSNGLFLFGPANVNNDDLAVFTNSGGVDIQGNFGSSIIQLEPNNILQSVGISEESPANELIPNIYHDMNSGTNYFWNVDTKSWQRTKASVAEDENILRSDTQTFLNIERQVGIKNLALEPETNFLKGQLYERNIRSPQPSQGFFRFFSNASEFSALITGILSTDTSIWVSGLIVDPSVESPSFESHQDFNGQIINTSGYTSNIFIARLNTEGEQIFIRTLGVSNPNIPIFILNLKVDENENAYLDIIAHGSSKANVRLLDLNNAESDLYATLACILGVDKEGNQIFLKIAGNRLIDQNLVVINPENKERGPEEERNIDEKR